MDFISGLRTVDFRVWISYLDVHFDYPNVVTRFTVDRASAYGTPTRVFQINNSEWFLVGPPSIDLNKSHPFSSLLCSTHACRKLTHEGALWFVSPVSLELQFRSGFPIKMSSCGLLLLIRYICCGCFMFAKS